mgnify:FL=1
MLISPAAQQWLEEGREEGRQEGRQEGELQGKRQMLVELITYRFGAPDAALLAALDVCSLEQLSVASRIVLDAGSAQEVLHRVQQLVAS